MKLEDRRMEEVAGMYALCGIDLQQVCELLNMERHQIPPEFFLRSDEIVDEYEAYIAECLENERMLSEYEDSVMSRLQEDDSAGLIPPQDYFVEEEVNKPRLYVQWLKYKKGFKRYVKDGKIFPATKRLLSTFFRESFYVCRQEISVAYYKARPYMIVKQ